MAKSIGFKKVKTAVFISGTGSNFINLLKFSLIKKTPIKIILLVSNNSKSKALKFIKRSKIKKMILRYNYKSKDENRILNVLKKNQIKLICLAGFMKILSPRFIKKFNGKILNIHPSLLPKYKGLNTHKRVIKNKEKYSGCSVHYVNERLDSGKIIIQKKVKILKKDTPISLAKKVLKQEHIIYKKAIFKVFSKL
tara:strand:+ start:1081 stop:1665 length:585 start_codon:yes stop_codon:yes gene_type:complete